MRRANKKDFISFSSPGVKHLRDKHGLEGYGLYLALVEQLLIYDNRIAVIDIEFIANKMRTNPAVITTILNHCSNSAPEFALMNFDGAAYSSLHIQQQTEKEAHIKRVRQQAAASRWSKRKGGSV